MDRRNKRERKRAATSVLYCSSSLFSLWMVFFNEQCCFLLFILIIFFNFIILCDCYISCVGVFFSLTFSWQFKLGVIIFGSVWFLSKKYNQAGFFLKKTKTEPVQTDHLRSGYFRKKPVQTGLTRFFPGWLDFFPGWLGFSFRFGFGSIRFGFFSFRLIKPNQSVFSKF